MQPRWIGISGAMALLAMAIVGLLWASPAAAGTCAEGVTEIGDTVFGTPCADVIVVDEPGVTEIRGGDGNDTLVAAGEVDVISAGDGDDVIVATPEVSEVFGGEGDDEIYGDVGPASVESAAELESGGASAAALAGPFPCATPSANDDVCYMADGSQEYAGGGGNDIIFGQRGNDTIFGQAGNDRLYGGIGDDEEVSGGPGDDLVAGGPGSDELLGGENSDIVRGDANADNLTGGTGTDTLSYATGVTPGFNPTGVSACGTANPCPGFPTTAEGSGVFVNLNQVNVFFAANNGTALGGGGQDTLRDAIENVIGTPFADYIVGDGTGNKIIGGGGADIILAGDGNDNLNGGADGDYIDGGTGTDEVAGGAGVATNNHCLNGESVTQCGGGIQSVVPRDSSRIAVGMVGTGIAETTYHMIYISGTPGVDAVSATVDASNNVVIQSSLEGPVFDENQQGCEVNRPRQVTCKPKALDAIVLAGLDGSDTINANFDFSGTVSPILLGGKGDDDLRGAEKTEDLLVDGPGSDILLGFAHDDDLISGEGADSLHGGADNDVLVSSTICDGGVMAGDAGADDIAWAQVPAPHRTATPGVWASLDQGKAAQVGISSNIDASCPGGQPTSLLTAENLEGTSGRDRLDGDSERNFLLGRAGVDSLFGFGGEDVLQANASDHDGNLDGGVGADRLKRDKTLLGDTLIDRDSASTEGDAVETLDPIYAGGFTPVEEERIFASSSPVAYFTLGEWTQAVAFEGRERIEGKTTNGTYLGGVGRGAQGALTDSDDPAVGLDGIDDAIELPNNWDPANFAASGYSVELWVNLNGEQGGQTRYLFNKFNGLSGVYLYRNPSGNFVFGTRAGNNQFDVTSAAVVSIVGWHHVVGTLNGNTTTLYIDGVPASKTFGQTVFPPLPNVAPNRVGTFENAGFLAADIDMLSIYGRALSPTEVAQHDALTR